MNYIWILGAVYITHRSTNLFQSVIKPSRILNLGLMSAVTILVLVPTGFKIRLKRGIKHSSLWPGNPRPLTEIHVGKIPGKYKVLTLGYFCIYEICPVNPAISQLM